MKMMKKFLVLLFVLNLGFVVYGQIDYFEHPDTAKKERLKISRPLFGGDFSLMLGSYTYVSLSPKIVYPVLEWFYAGVGGDFMYIANQNNAVMMYGGDVFLEAFLIKYITFHAEYQVLNVPDYNSSTLNRVWYNAEHVGLGYRQFIGTKAYVVYLLLWNFNHSLLSPYINPSFRISFYF